MQGVYLIHIEPAFRHFRHYLGWSPNIEKRFKAHKNGQGARLTKLASMAGHELKLARVWLDATPIDERRLKGRSLKPLCPVCSGKTCPPNPPQAEKA